MAVNEGIENFLPSIARGAHAAGDGQACVMEYVSILAGEGFSDHPSCTHPVLAEAARTTNDLMSDEGRYKLVPVITRLFGTNEERPAKEAAQLSAKLARFVADYATAKSKEGGFFDQPADDRLVAYLTSLLDYFDQVTGRKAEETKVLSDVEQKLLLAGATAR